MKNIPLITDTSSLESFCQRMADEKFITVDTEFLRENTYWPILCLIQVAGADEAVLIDPLSKNIDLECFYSLMRDKNVVKVFHAARQDLEIIHHLGNTIPAPLFDSQVAAMVCGFGDSISYDHLVQRICNVQIDKSSRFTDWSRRPLSEKQLSYALADVTHLRQIYETLSDKLEKSSREAWVEEEMEILNNPRTYDIQPVDAWKKLKVRARRPVELATTQNLAAWRESEAKARDIPRRRVLKDDAIFELALQRPSDLDGLKNSRSLPRGFEGSRYANPLLDAIARAVSLAPHEMPKIPKPTRRPEGSGAVVDLLKILLKLVSEEHQVASKIIATVDDLEKIADCDTADTTALTGWRRDLFGGHALKVKNGELGFALSKKNKVVLIPISEND